MIELLIIADDLTGAIDTGAQLSKKGVPTMVSYDIDIDFHEIPGNIRVLVVDTENRYRETTESLERTNYLFQNAKHAGIEQIFVYRDAILRGNIGVEFESLLEQYNSNVLSYIPACPKAKIYTKKGYQYVDDTLLENSIFAADPSEPIAYSYIPDAIKKQTKIKSRVVSPKRIGSEKILRVKNKRILVFDCETSSDMRNIGKFLQTQGALKLLAGGPAFAELLPELLNLHCESMVFTGNTKPILLINGSLDRVSLEQSEFASANGFFQAVIPPRLLYAKNIEQGKDINEFVLGIKKAVLDGKNVVMQSVKMRSRLQLYINQGGMDTVDKREIYSIVLRNTGIIAKRLLNENIFGNLIVFGGDTTLEILKTLSISYIFPRTEILPGLCYVNMDGAYQDIPLISKHGSFGQIDTIIKIMHFLGKH